MLSLELLQNCFYLVFGFAVTAYAILDGFDLGTGMLHLFTKNDTDRRIFLNAIGPVWDGNAVWIVIVMGVLFAAFPPVFASMFAGFYLMSMILISGFMFRAVAIEFRSKKPEASWRNFWDRMFAISSFVIAFCVGTMLGNLIEGLPLDQNGNFLAGLETTFRPYSVLVGFLSVSLFSMHGAIYLCMKTEGALHEKLRGWVAHLIKIFFAIYIITTLATLKYMPHMLERLKEYPWLGIFPLLTPLSLLSVVRLFKNGKDLRAFGSSAIGIAMLFITFGIGTFPNLIRSSTDPQYSFTIYNSSSSKLTLTVLFFIVVIGVPLVLFYGSVVYKVFKGKVKIDKSSY
jgi:cytochrome bd ubiquinol oxidase subunit II